jgi:hypothetical protein
VERWSIRSSRKPISKPNTRWKSTKKNFRNGKNSSKRSSPGGDNPQWCFFAVCHR